MACNGRGGVSPTRGFGWVAVFLVMLLLPKDAWAKRPVAFEIGRTLPQHLIALKENQVSSSCYCRIKCMINMSCTAVSVLVNKDTGVTNCLFSNTIIPLGDLSEEHSAYTWVHNATNTTNTEASSSTTSEVTTPTATPGPTPTSTSVGTTSLVTTTPTMTTTPSTTGTTSSTASKGTTTTATTSATTKTSTCLATTTFGPHTPQTTNTATESVSGDSNWIPYGTSCYFFSSDTANWNTANQSCINMNSTLAVITSHQEHHFILGMVVTDAWIGLYSPYSNKTYLWIDGTIPNLFKWLPGQPDNWSPNGATKESCGEMHKHSNSGGWNDASCSTLYRYVCEKSA